VHIGPHASAYHHVGPLERLQHLRKGLDRVGAVGIQNGYDRVPGGGDAGL